MKLPILPALILIGSLARCLAGVDIDNDAFAKSLGGWKKGNNFADYTISGANYRSYKPEISPTPDGGIFVSVRIDHLRGWLSSNDHAGLEVTVNSKGLIVSTQSTIAIQGQSIASDVIVGTSEAGKALLAPDRAVQIGTDLVTNLTAKLLRENMVEAGRVSFPAALRHNYNRLFQAIRVDAVAAPTAIAVPDAPVVPPPGPVPPAAPPQPPQPPAPSAPAAPATPPPAKPNEPAKPAVPDPQPPAVPGTKPLEIKPYAAAVGRSASGRA